MKKEKILHGACSRSHPTSAKDRGHTRYVSGTSQAVRRQRGRAISTWDARPRFSSLSGSYGLFFHLARDDRKSRRSDLVTRWVTGNLHGHGVARCMVATRTTDITSCASRYWGTTTHLQLTSRPSHEVTMMLRVLHCRPERKTFKAEHCASTYLEQCTRIFYYQPKPLLRRREATSRATIGAPPAPRKASVRP